MTSGAPFLLTASPIPAAGERVELPEAEVRHVKVRRLRDGDAVTVIDGRGGRAAGVLAPGGTSVLVTCPEPPSGESSVAVTLILPAAEPARVEWAVEKGTECGATAFRIAVFARSQRSHAAALASRLARLRRVAAEAVKQCGRTVVPEVSGPEPFLDALEGSRRAGPVVLLAPDAPPLDLVVPVPLPPRLAVVIGPEGGLTEAESRAASEAGALAAGLGPRILRLETAAVVALARLVDRPAR